MTTSLVDFYATRPAPCPYLPDREERKVLAELPPGGGFLLYDRLARAGFRRSHTFAYRPHCLGCHECLSVRVVVEQFRATKSMRRVDRRNAGLAATLTGARATDEQFDVFDRYLRSRHAGGEMVGMKRVDYGAMVEESTVDTSVVEFRDRDGVLRACLLTDALTNGFSAVYSFFDPDIANDSPGTFMVLWLIERARRAGLPYVYLGYWVQGSPKMQYKIRFAPLQSLGPRGWRLLDPSRAAQPPSP